MSLLRNQEREIAELDYRLRKDEVEKEIQSIMDKIAEKVPNGVWLSEYPVRDSIFDRILIDEKGVYLFCRFEKELTDQDLWNELGKMQRVFLYQVEKVSEKDLSFYALLNGPISQKVYCALYNPNIEFLTPVMNLEETFLADLEQKEAVYTDEDIISILSCFETEEEEAENGDVVLDGGHEFIKVRGHLKLRSGVDAERYFWLTLFGGLFGLHKFYAKCYGSFFAYLFTLGFFGFGWVYDLMEICLGISRDGKKAYIGPYKDKKTKWMICSAVLVVYATLLVVLFAVV